MKVVFERSVISITQIIAAKLRELLMKSKGQMYFVVHLVLDYAISNILMHSGILLDYST